MAYTQSHLDALQEALASGTLTVTSCGVQSQAHKGA
jgi:hypothetical protein